MRRTFAQSWVILYNPKRMFAMLERAIYRSGKDPKTDVWKAGEAAKPLNPNQST